MPNIADHHSKQCTKLLAIGNSGSGKTGALASLAAAGYNLRIIDLDNGVDILHHYLTDANSPYVKANPQIAQKVEYITITDHMIFYDVGKIAPKSCTVWRKVIATCKEWPNLGPITTWGPQDILVVDSLSKLAEAALFFHLDLNNALDKMRNTREFSRDIGSAQALVMGFLSMLYEDEIKCNIIVNSHVKMTTASGESANREKTNQELIGFPNAIGSAISPMIPRFFNTQLVFKELGVGASARRMIYTVPTMISDHIVSSKTTAPLKVAESYPIANGLADYFKAVRS